MGEMCRETLSKGHYVADSEMFVLWKQRLKEKDTQNGWVIDGFPRNMSQALFLDDKLDKYHKTVDAVFYLEVSEDVSISRLTRRGRKNPDGSLHDTPEKIKERLKRYKFEEKDVLNFYKNKKVLFSIDGQQSIEEISKNIINLVKKLSKI